MRQSEAWLLQVASDADTAEMLYRQALSNGAFRCQALAKYQQVVEKSVKAMVAAINDLGVQFHTILPAHDPVKEIDALRQLKSLIDDASLENLRRTFTEKRLQKIHDLCRLAPTFPQKGQPFLIY